MFLRQLPPLPLLEAWLSEYLQETAALAANDPAEQGNSLQVPLFSM